MRIRVKQHGIDFVYRSVSKIAGHDQDRANMIKCQSEVYIYISTKRRTKRLL